MKYKKYTIDTIHEIVKDKPIQFISKKYTGMCVKYDWQCDICSSTWQARPSEIRRGASKCLHCVGKKRIEYKKYIKYTIDTIQEVVGDRPIKFISKEYTRIDKNHDWQCNICNYIWRAKPHDIRHGGRGCPYCAGRHRTIEDMHKLATERGFEFVSSVFTKINDKHKWKCQDGHTWRVSPRSIKSKNSGCPYCNTNLSEEKCRFIFESLTGYKFPKTRSVLNNHYELDGYCSELKLAFEYQGQQHFKTMYFHTKKSGLKEQQERDKTKRQQCKQQNIKLIEIPCHCASTDSDLEECIRKYVKTNKKVIWEHFVGKPSELAKIQQIAQTLNQTCLSKVYRGDRGPIDLQCNKCHHKWTSRAGYVKRKFGCPQKCDIHRRNKNSKLIR